MDKIIGVFFGLLFLSQSLIAHEYKSVDKEDFKLLLYMDYCCSSKQFNFILPDEKDDVGEFMQTFKLLDSVHHIKQFVLPFSFYEAEFFNFTIETHQPGYLEPYRREIYSAFQGDSVYCDKVKFKGSKSLDMFNEGYSRLLYILSALLKKDADLNNYPYIAVLKNYADDFSGQKNKLDIEVLKSINGHDPYSPFYNYGDEVKDQLFLFLKQKWKEDPSFIKLFHKEELVENMMKNPFLSKFGTAYFSDSLKLEWLNKHYPQSAIQDSVATIFFEEEGTEFFNKNLTDFYFLPGDKNKIERRYENGNSEKEFRITYYKNLPNKRPQWYSFDSYLFAVNYGQTYFKAPSFEPLFVHGIKKNESLGFRFQSNFNETGHFNLIFNRQSVSSDLDSFSVNYIRNQYMIGGGWDFIPISFINLTAAIDAGWACRIINISGDELEITQDYSVNENYKSKSYAAIVSPKANLTFSFPYFSFGGEVGYNWNFYSTKLDNGFSGRDNLNGLYFNLFAGINIYLEK